MPLLIHTNACYTVSRGFLHARPAPARARDLSQMAKTKAAWWAWEAEGTSFIHSVICSATTDVRLYSGHQ